MMKKKCHLKNDNMFYFIIENHTQIVSPGKKTYSTACAKT